MKLESQVITLDIAKRLCELNIKQNSLFVWEYFNDSCYAVKFIPYAVIPDEFNGYKRYSAFTSSELFEMLPSCIDIKKDEPFNFYWLYVQKRSAKNIKYIANYGCDSFDAYDFTERRLIGRNSYDDNLANALAKTIIYLLENNFIKVDDIK